MMHINKSLLIQLELKLKNKWWYFWVLQIIALFSGAPHAIKWIRLQKGFTQSRSDKVELLNNFDMEDIDPRHSDCDERDIEERYPLSFTTLWCFKSFQIIVCRMWRKCPNITFCDLYFSANIFLEFILRVVVYKSYRPFLLFSYEKFWFKFSQKIQKFWASFKKF